MLIHPHHQKPPEIGKKSPTSTQHQPQVANSMFVSGEDALSSFDCREDRNESDDRKAGSNVSSAKNCVAGRPRRTPPPDGYLSMMSTRQKNHAAETIY